MSEERPTFASCHSCGWIGPIVDQGVGCCGDEICPKCKSTDTWWITRAEGIAEIDEQEDDPDARIKYYEEAKLL